MSNRKMKNKIAFILDHKLQHYRAPLFSALEKNYSVTVFHRGPLIENSCFQQEIVSYKKIGPFEHIAHLSKLSEFDAVVIMQNLRIINLYSLPFTFKNKPILMWGIGTSSASGLGTESALFVFLRNTITSMYAALALYSPLPVGNYWKSNQKKISIVGNSIVNEQSVDTSYEPKRYFLFIGSLDKRKGLNELIHSFNQALAQHPALKLKIVGDGPEKLELEEQVSCLGLTNSVEFLGAIHDPLEKNKVFTHAYCTISPLQAGLSVVESFSYGVPFVTSSKAITGGESQSIIHDENGVLFKDIEELSDIICSFVDGRRSSAVLGSNAYQYYKQHLVFDLYVERFKQFINQHL